jgi:ATP-dependent RNA helicase RhlE
LPNVPETYVHRIGRTGRAGLSGIALSFCDHEEKAYLKDIHKLIGRQIPVITDHPYPLSDSPANQEKVFEKKAPAHKPGTYLKRKKSWNQPENKKKVLRKY